MVTLSLAGRPGRKGQGVGSPAGSRFSRCSRLDQRRRCRPGEPRTCRRPIAALPGAGARLRRHPGPIQSEVQGRSRQGLGVRLTWKRSDGDHAEDWIICLFLPTRETNGLWQIDELDRPELRDDDALRRAAAQQDALAAHPRQRQADDTRGGHGADVDRALCSIFCSRRSTASPRLPLCAARRGLQSDLRHRPLHQSRLRRALYDRRLLHISRLYRHGPSRRQLHLAADPATAVYVIGNRRRPDGP